MEIKIYCKSILLMLLVLLPELNLFSQVVTISRDWKFKTGDSLNWSASDYNDTQWDNLKAGLWWAHAGYDYSGFAWYRKKIVISSELKPAVKKTGYLKLSLGQIQDADQTFLNGKLIGETGSFSPFEGKWGQPRNYFVRADEIEWDKENTIAVRVYGPNKNGGMHTGPYTYQPYRLTFKDFVKVRNSYIQPLKINNKDGFLVSVIFTNSGPRDYKGELAFTITDTSKATLNGQKQIIKILANSDSSNKFSFFIEKPLPDIYHISAVFTESKTKGFITKEITVSSLKDVYLPLLVQPAVVIENKIKDVFISAPFENQKIGGIMGERLVINLNKRLLEVDEMELLAGYQNRPGKQNWVGEHVGKYLDAASNAWRYSHDPHLKTQMDRILLILLNTQKEDGYLGTYTPEQYWTNWDVWSHKYNMIGLLSYYKVTGYTPALNAAKRIGDLLCKTFGDNPGQLDIITSGTHVGMASASVLDPIVELFRYTGDKKYLDFAHYIIRSYDHPDGPAIIKTLLENGHVNQVANGKAYELLSNLVGIIKLYKLTGEEELYNAVKIAWKDIMENRLYITGTASSYELFRPDQVLPASADDHMGEGCVTTTWFQLNYQLFTLTGELKYFEQLEKTAYNHLTGAENPLSGCVSYYTPLQDKKPYSCDITCCLSSIPRGISMIPLINYGKNSGIPTLLLSESGIFTDSVLSTDGESIPIKIVGESYVPDSGIISYAITPEHTAFFSINLRIPLWANHYTASINGEFFQGMPGNYLTIKRKWAPGDIIVVHFDIPTIVMPGGKSYPDRIAFKRGPQVLALDQSLNSSSIDSIEISSVNSVEITLTNEVKSLPKKWIGKQAYSFKGQDKDGKVNEIILVPYSDASQTEANTIVWIKRF